VSIKEIYLVLISPSDNETRVENGTEVKLRGGHLGVGCVAVADSTLHPPEVVVTLDGVDRTEVFRATKEVAITPDTYEWDSGNWSRLKFEIKLAKTIKFIYLTSL